MNVLPVITGSHFGNLFTALFSHGARLQIQIFGLLTSFDKLRFLGTA